ncbi:MAG: hypothetical protein JO316_26045 [Abitibacteriaceae bacterium]|nr:hypothetical protein [Abditibacteriaceae bacterium]
MNILVNLRAGFFEYPALAPVFELLAALGTVRQTSHDTADEFRPDLAGADAVLMWSWPAWTDELLDAAPNLRYAGHLDLGQAGAQVALRRGLPVSISRHGWSPAVAEMALGLMLNLLRRQSDYHALMRVAGEPWVRSFPTGVDPQERELTGRSVGLVGLGHVGRRLAELLAPFHPTLRVVDPFVPDAVIQAHGATRVSLEEMLHESDVVVLCAASNSGTQHLLGRSEIALLRPHAVFINVARAALVDTAVLVERLQQGDLLAAIDVFDREPLDGDAALRALPNAYLTPHRAGGTLASALRTLHWLVDDLEAIMQGRERQYPLTETMLPSLDA